MLLMTGVVQKHTSGGFLVPPASDLLLRGRCQMPRVYISRRRREARARPPLSLRVRMERRPRPNHGCEHRKSRCALRLLRMSTTSRKWNAAHAKTGTVPDLFRKVRRACGKAGDGTWRALHPSAPGTVSAPPTPLLGGRGGRAPNAGLGAFPGRTLPLATARA